MKIQKKFGAAVLSLGLVVGLSGFAGATQGTIDTTGPYSDNTIEAETSQRVEVENDNEVEVENDNEQAAVTGEAEAEHNTTAGDVRTGDAANHNDFSVSASVDNSASVAAMSENTGGNWGGGNDKAVIENTGPSSDNYVEIEKRSTVEIENDNEIEIENNNDQFAASGDAEVEGNTTGGDAVTGDATNTNSTSVTLNIKN